MIDPTNKTGHSLAEEKTSAISEGYEPLIRLQEAQLGKWYNFLNKPQPFRGIDGSISLRETTWTEPEMKRKEGRALSDH